MNQTLSRDAQIILMLTAPLAAGRGDTSTKLLSLEEYNQLARVLRDRKRRPANLIGPHSDELVEAASTRFGRARLEALLNRGFLLSQAVEYWHARAIWVVSRADAEYPRLLKTRLREEAPPVLYGCGEASILETGDGEIRVLNGGLETAVLARENRTPLREHRLVFVSPLDPQAGRTPGGADDCERVAQGLSRDA